MSVLLDSIFRHAKQQPGATALVSPKETISFGELERRVRELASDLRARGVERAGLAGDNTCDWIIADLACVLAKVVCVPIPVFFSKTQREHLMDAAGLDALLYAGDNADVKNGELMAGSLRLFSPAIAEPRPSIPVATAKITFTSGSTGTPKGVCLSQDQLEKTVQALDERLAAVELKTHLCVLPLATLLENVAGVYLSLLRGNCVVVIPGEELGLSGSSGLEPGRLASTLNQWQPQSLILVPELARALLTLAAAGVLETEHYRFLAVGGARVAPALIEQAEELGLLLYEGYGLSECGSVVALNVPGNSDPESCGQPLGHVAVTVAADGRVLVEGNRFLGYLGDDELPETSQLDTGDLGSLDAAGYLRINGRRKNLIITGFGRNISPEWLESELVQATGVAQVLVFGDGDQQPSALVFARSDQSNDDIVQGLNRLNASLPDYARLAALYRMPAPFSVEAGQLTANGRLRRAEILGQVETLKAASRILSPASPAGSSQTDLFRNEDSSRENKGVHHGVF